LTQSDPGVHASASSRSQSSGAGCHERAGATPSSRATPRRSAGPGGSLNVRRMPRAVNFLFKPMRWLTGA
jgi:hypothetical protein